MFCYINKKKFKHFLNYFEFIKIKYITYVIKKYISLLKLNILFLTTYFLRYIELILIYGVAKNFWNLFRTFFFIEYVRYTFDSF